MKLTSEEIGVDLPNAGMNEEEFFAFCMAHPELSLERDKNGNILVAAPTHFDSGRNESHAHGELYLWNRKTQSGIVFSSSTGFTLPNGAVRSPDVAWIANDRVSSLPKSEHKKFAHICPDFVIEIRSESDHLPPLQKKMEEYIENGARLGFLVDPYKRNAYIYRADKTKAVTDDFTQTLKGEDVLPGFELALGVFTTK